MALFGRGNDLPTLLKKLESKSYKTKQEKRELIEALGTQGDLRTEDYLRFLLGNDADLSRFAMDRIGGTQNRRMLDQLLKALPSAHRTTKRRIIMAIHKVDASELPDRLAQMLASKSLEPRAAAMEVLAASPAWKSSMRLIKQALRDPEVAIRVRAVGILGQDPRDPAVQMLLRDLMYSQDDGVRFGAIEALARDPDPDLIDDFFDLLPNLPPRLQEVVIHGLRRFISSTEGGLSERVLERLMPLLAADDQMIREAAAQILASMRDQLYVLRRFLQYVKGIAFWLRDRGFNAIATVSDNVVDAILTLMQDEDVDVVVGATVMARNSRDPRLFDGLQAVLRRDLDWWIKVPALETLGTFEDPRVHALLVEKLDDPELCTAALASLGQRGNRQALPHIVEYLRNEQVGLRRAAIGALASFRDRDLVGVLEAVARSDSDDDCRYAALEQLDGMGAEGVAAAAAVRQDLQTAGSTAGDGPMLEMMRPNVDDDE